MKAWGIAALVPVLALAACQSAPEPTLGVACDEATLSSTIDMFLHESDQHLLGIEEPKCSGDWALVEASLEDQQRVQTHETYVFERAGDNWVLKAPEIVCGSPTTDGQRPVDALVPEDLWASACLTA
ncbi:MAG: hypothetical protein WC005_07165 [Candidatus Nanopelagicales bacterium]